MPVFDQTDALILGACLLVPALFIVAAVGLEKLGKRRVEDVLQSHQADLAALDGDPTVPPTSAPGPETLIVRIAKLPIHTLKHPDGARLPGPMVDVLQTSSAPVLAVLRGRAGGEVDAIKPYLVASVYQRLNGQPAIRPLAYDLLSDGALSVPDYQVETVLVTAEDGSLTETWTLFRRKQLIQCRTCAGSVSGIFQDPCPRCSTPCTGFEAGWRVLEISASPASSVQGNAAA